mgnify:CR=1 FL=1
MFNTIFTKLNALPVNDIMIDVAADYVSDIVPIITSQVASGKTMLLPAACAMAMQSVSDDDVIYVLQPTKFLASNASDNLIKILDSDPDRRIGYLNGIRTGTDNRFGDNTRLVFTTVGYALASGIVATKKNFIIDEAHELSLDLSITKAVLHNRMKTESDIRLMIMSATLNLEEEEVYWGTVRKTEHYTTEGSAFPLTMYHRPSFGLDDAVLELITSGHRGILVFVSGTVEIDKAITDIKYRLAANNIADYSISGIHGRSDRSAVKEASADPTRTIKILVGTNVLESGISLPWVDSGVSSGNGKVMHIRNHMHTLVEEPLVAWRVIQQAGRTCRFQPGTFYLCHMKSIEQRPKMQVPDIKRLPLTDLVMYCAKNHLIIKNLEFPFSERPDQKDLIRAVYTLETLGLITELSSGELMFTDDGELVKDAPLSPIGMAMYAEALKRNIVPLALPLITFFEIGDVVHNLREGYKRTYCRKSDPINGLCCVAETLMQFRNCRNRREELAICEERNISYRKLMEFRLLLTNLQKALDTKIDAAAYYVTPNTSDAFNSDIVPQLTPLIARGFATQIHEINYRGIRLPEGLATQSDTSVVDLYDGNSTHQCVCTLRRIVPRRGGAAFTLFENVTIID